MFNFQGMDKNEILALLGKLYKRQVCLASVLVVLAVVAFKPYLGGAIGGAVWSLLDTLLIVLSVMKGLDKIDIGKVRAQVFLNFIKRFVLAIAMLFVVRYFRASLLVMLLVFAVMHCGLIVNLLIFTRQHAQKKVS